MNTREKREALENLIVCDWGIKAAQSKGRPVFEAEDGIRTCFQRDVDRIIHSKSFRRLKHKTQVFLQPEGDHYRTRLTHTLEVSRIARTIARALELNEDLTEAIAMGHDLGHTPFGHAGERALNRIFSGGFKHYEQSLRVADVLEREGQGLNLCFETRMGILHHTKGSPDDTLEATLVRLSDWIAYVNHDLDDAIRAGIVSSSDIPERIRRECGEKNSQRINAIVSDLIANSGNGEIKMSDSMWDTFMYFRDYMYSVIYVDPVAKKEEQKVDGIIEHLYDYYTSDASRLPGEYRAIADSEGVERSAVDYISGMSDDFAVSKYTELFIPLSWRVK